MSQATPNTEVIENVTLPLAPQDFSSKRYDPVGICIYCGNRDSLSDEHIVPYGLGGKTLLPKASCEACREITARLEFYSLRGPAQYVRAFLDLPTRRPHERPKTAPLVVTKNGEEVEVQLPISEYPVLLMLPVFNPPGPKDPEQAETGVHIRRTCTILFGKPPADVCTDLKAQDVRIEQTYRPAEFARMIAKISYSWAVAEYGVPSKLDTHITRIIRGLDKRIGLFVGNPSDELKPYPGFLHRLILNAEGEDVLGIVQLFANAPSPAYTVVLGRKSA